MRVPIEHRNTRRTARVKRVRQRDLVLASMLAGVASNVRKNGQGAR